MPRPTNQLFQQAQIQIQIQTRNRTIALCTARTTSICCSSTRTPVLARPTVLARSISTGISKPKSKFRSNQSLIFTRTMSNYNKGDLPTFGFPEKQPSEGEKQLVEDVLKLYQLKPTSAVYARYAPDSQFHDPIGLAQGLDSIKAQFNAMASSFKSSETIALKYLDNPEVKPPSVQFALSQNYVIGSTEKLVNSKITLHVDPSSNLIKQHDEEWDGKPNTTGEDGFVGKLNELRKKVTANVVKAAADQTPPTEKN